MLLLSRDCIRPRQGHNNRSLSRDIRAKSASSSKSPICEEKQANNTSGSQQFFKINSKDEALDAKDVMVKGLLEAAHSSAGFIDGLEETGLAKVYGKVVKSV